jgi:hypothetical protein
LERDRVAAAIAAWTEVEEGVRNRDRTRYALKNLAWSGSTERTLRLTVLDLLMSDQSDEGEADSRAMARLILPNERDAEAVRIIAGYATQNGWNELLPAMVRSLAKLDPEVADRDRPEYAAIEQLSNGQPIEQVVFDVFLNPSLGIESDQEQAVLRSDERTRDDAWGLLGRLDSTGTLRERFLSATSSLGPDADEGSKALVADLRAARDELGVIPDTSLEIAWLQSIRNHPDARNNDQNKQWWGQVQAAVRTLDAQQRDGLSMRHLEPIRWSSVNRSAWLNLDREALYGVLNTRLRGRVLYKRKSEKGERPRKERLGDWAEQLSWADLLTVLIVDEAFASSAVQEQIFSQRALDKKDTSTEYGGVIEPDVQERWRAVLFRPRQRDRLSDELFVASDDMFRFSDRSLAHYHFHVNNRDNAKYAGPSVRDLINANNSRRTSIVITSMGSDELNVDVYFGNGIVIDLGLIVLP